MNLRKLFTSAIIVTYSLSALAGRLTLTDGSINDVKGSEYISVVLDCSQTVYKGKKADSFSGFMKLHRRLPKWEAKSIEYFCEWFNDETAKITACPDSTNSQYEIVVVVNEIYDNGRINADIIIRTRETKKKIASFSLKGGDGDAEDMILLRDPMKDAGECLGKYFNKNL